MRPTAVQGAQTVRSTAQHAGLQLQQLAPLGSLIKMPGYGFAVKGSCIGHMYDSAARSSRHWLPGRGKKHLHPQGFT